MRASIWWQAVTAAVEARRKPTAARLEAIDRERDRAAERILTEQADRILTGRAGRAKARARRGRRHVWRWWPRQNRDANNSRPARSQ